MSKLTQLRRMAELQQYSAMQDWAAEHGREHMPAAANCLLSIAARHLGDVETADSMLATAQSHRDQLDEDGLCDFAAALLACERPDEAAECLREILEGNPCHSLALARLGYCRLLQGQSAEAMDLFRASIRLEPGRLAVHCNLLGLLIEAGQLEEARTGLVTSRELLAEQENALPLPFWQDFAFKLDALQLRYWLAVGDYATAESWFDSLLEFDAAPEILTRNQLDRIQLYARSLAEIDAHDLAVHCLYRAMARLAEACELKAFAAEILTQQGRYQQALCLLQDCIGEQAQVPQWWIQYAHVALLCHDSAAEMAAQKAVALVEGFELAHGKTGTGPAERMLWMQAYNVLAQQACSAQQYETAQRLFEKILEFDPQFAPALQGLGSLHLQLGRIDEAVAAFRTIGDTDPVRSHVVLMTAREFPDSMEVLERLQQAANIPSLEGSVRSGILFQLAQAWERRGDYERAMDCAVHANESAAQKLRYRRQRHRNYCHRIRMRFSEEFFRHRQGVGHGGERLLFIVGMPRSGTSLVEQLLAGHSDIHAAGELNLIPQLIQGLNRWERHIGSGRLYPECADDIAAAEAQGIAKDLLASVDKLSADARYVIDKLPHNFENIGLIKLLLPEVKILSIRRDPRDIGLSNYFTDFAAKFGGLGFAYDLRSIGEQLADHNLLMHHWHRLFPGQILELNYENIVADAETACRRILDYLGLGWQPSMLNFQHLQRPVRTASVWQVRQGLYAGSVGKWRHYERHLEPLIAGTNAKIQVDPVTMTSLPEPGYLGQGLAHFQSADFDAAERCFKLLLHFVPDHLAALFMLGKVYISKGFLNDGTDLMAQAVERAPWRKDWADTLALVTDSSRR